MNVARILGSTLSDLLSFNQMVTLNSFIKIDVTLIALLDPNPPLPCTNSRQMFGRSICSNYLYRPWIKFYLKTEPPQSLYDFQRVLLLWLLLL